MNQWFTFHNERVQGPFSTDQMQEMIESRSLSEQHLVWGSPMTKWMNPGAWAMNLASLETQVKRNHTAQMWHYAFDGEAFGPFTRDELIHELKNTKKPHEALLWSKGLKSWSPVFEFYDVMEDIGINRRQYPRARVEGRVALKIDDQNVIGVLQMIGEGGFGASGLSDLNPGQFVSVEILARSFREPIYAKAEVRSVEENGSCGFRFVQISIEAKSKIIQYIRQSMGSAKAA
jgi:hypothetical protein